MLKKEYRLISSRDFKVIYRYGVKIRGEYGMLIVLPPQELCTDPPRFGFVVNKKVGNAVIRHLVTRRLRSLVHKIIPEYSDFFNGYRFSYISFKEESDFSKLEKEFRWQLEKGKKMQN
jgi:ribonuclease P protein component